MADRWRTLALIFCTRISMGVQFQSIASVAPLLVDDLHVSYVEAGTLVGLYLAPGVVLSVPGGWLGRRLGERRAVVGSLALMVVGGAITAWSGGFATAAAGRLVSGAGAVLMNLLLIKLTADWFATREMATAMGVVLAAWPVGLGVAVAGLGAVASATSWRMAIALASATALLGLVLMAFVVRDAPVRTDAGRPAGLRARDVALALSSGVAWGTFYASLVVVVAFAPPMLIARGASLGQAGFVASLAIWVTIMSVPLGGLLSDRLGRPNLFIVIGCATAAGVLLAMPAMRAEALALFLVGAVIGAAAAPLTSLLPRALPPERLSAGLGVSYTAYYVVMAAALPAAGLVRDLTGDPAVPIELAALIMAATLLGLLAFRVIERRRPRPH
jgi:predicted MFS family arabinose efflux permease